MSFPRRKDRFTAWSKAMVEGATVDKPLYPGTALSRRSSRSSVTRRKRRKKRKNAKKD